jgi:hydrogenase expression/formation protein HypE
MIARGELELEMDIKSDTAPLNSLVQDMLDVAGCGGAFAALHCLGDPTRGGAAPTLNEVALVISLGLLRKRGVAAVAERAI